MLSPFQEAMVRKACPCQVEILRSHYLQALRPCPIRVDLSDGGNQFSVVLRIARNRGGVEREALVFPVLKRLGLPVPGILVPPCQDPEAPELFSMMVTDLIPGEELLSLSLKSQAGLNLSVACLNEAFDRLRSVTQKALAEPELETLPRRTLKDDLEGVNQRRSDWNALPNFQNALDLVGRQIPTKDAPLMFTNGDFQPANFLTDGQSLSGLVDFEKAGFVDPLTVLTRIPVYNVLPLCETTFIADLLLRHGFTEQEFAPRVAVFCLRTLQTKLPVTKGTSEQEVFRDHVLGVLERAMRTMS